MRTILPHLAAAACVWLAALSNSKGANPAVERNKTKNAVKHHKKSEPELLTLNQFDEAYWMIERALRNAELRGIGVVNRDEYKNWLIVNIHM